MATARLLVVEDERHLAAGLKMNLELEEYEVDIAATATEAAKALAQPESYDAIILDVMLPDFDGFELCRRMRDAGNLTPIIMLTARDTPEDRVTGLEAGADDYLVKPFELAELLARVKVLLRRRDWDREGGESSAVLEFGNAHVDFDAHSAEVGGEPLALTHLEIELLRYFARNPGRVLSRDELLERVWKLRNYPNTRVVDNFIVRLRKYFEPDPSNPVFFLSIRGAGYKFEPQAS